MNYLLFNGDKKMDFRTRRKDGIIFPIDSGKEIRKTDDWVRDESELDPNPEDTDPNDEEYLQQLEEEEQMRKEELRKQEERKKSQEMHKLENPSFSSRLDTKSDVKKLMRTNSSQVDKEKNFDKYKQRLNRDLTETYIKEDKRADKRRERAINKAQKLQEKSEKMQKKSEQIKGEYQ